eukprot:g14354.t1
MLLLLTTSLRVHGASSCEPGYAGDNCTACAQGYFSPGGIGVNCTKCPSDKPYTGDGKATTTGADSCSNAPTCIPGEGTHYDKFETLSSGYCRNEDDWTFIRNEDDCKAAAAHNNLAYEKFESYAGKGDYIGNHHAMGCFYNNEYGNRLYFNPYFGSKKECSSRERCICDTVTCQNCAICDKTKCKQGYYSEGGVDAACKSCPSYKPYTLDGNATTVGATSSSACNMKTCDPGYGLPSDYSSPVCTACAQGHFSPGGKGATCTKCPSDKPYTGDGKPTTTAATAADSCSNAPTCIPGEGTRSEKCCTKCEQGYYSEGGVDAACKRCPSDKPYTLDGNATTVGATSSSACNMKTCEPGYGLPSDYSTPLCSVCPQGYYSPGGRGATCTKCPSDKFYTLDGKVSTTGATSNASCYALPVCIAGQGVGQGPRIRTSGYCSKYISSKDECSAAGVATGNTGYYISATDDDRDRSDFRPKGCYFESVYISERVGRRRVLRFNSRMTNFGECAFRSNTNYRQCLCAGVACSYCAKGYISPGGENASCTKCPADKPFAKGGISCYMPTCDPGSGVPSDYSSPICNECRQGFYSPDGVGACTKCPSDKPYTGDGRLIGATNSTSCKMLTCDPGYGLPSDFSAPCTACAQGYFSPGGKGAVCTKCPSDKPWIGDGKMTTRGAISNAACSDTVTCIPGYGSLYALVTGGTCDTDYLEYISSYDECNAAATTLQFLDRTSVENNGYRNNGASNIPKGCYYHYDNDDRLELNVKMNNWGSCSDNFLCLCKEKNSCSACAQGYYSEGGSGPLCTKCPSDKPYIGDGKVTTTGATSNASCSATMICRPGDGISYVEFTTRSYCREIIDETECKALAEYNSKSFKSVRNTRGTKGCVIWYDDGYEFNEVGYRPCTDNTKCVCATKGCATCNQGYYSPGGSNVTCKKCPSNKPYTGDGKSTTTGATSISSLGVEVGRVNIIDIIEVQKRQRHLLGSSNIQIIYEVKVNDNAEAKKMQSSMEAKEFKSTLSTNLQAESPSLNALIVQSVEQPKVHQRKIEKKNDEEGDQDGSAIQEKSTDDKSSFWPIVGIVILFLIAVGCGGAAGKIYFGKKQKFNQGVSTGKLVKGSSPAKSGKNKNSWDMASFEMQKKTKLKGENMKGNPLSNDYK